MWITKLMSMSILCIVRTHHPSIKKPMAFGLGKKQKWDIWEEKKLGTEPEVGETPRKM